jgi:hypothetical protein
VRPREAPRGPRQAPAAARSPFGSALRSGRRSMGRNGGAPATRPPSPAGPFRSPASRFRAAGCGRRAARSGGFRRRRGRGAGARGSQVRSSSPGAVRCSTDLDGSLRRWAGSVTPRGAAGCIHRGRRSCGRAGRRRSMRGLHFRSKWRETDGLARSSGYHASHRLSVPMLGGTPATGATPLPSDRSYCRKIGFGAPSKAAPDWGIRGERPIYRLSTETIPAHDIR